MANDLNTWAHRPEPHYSPETRRTRCDNCEYLYCIEQEKAKLHRWAYYCEKMRRRFTFKELYAITMEECPIHRDIRGRLH